MKNQFRFGSDEDANRYIRGADAVLPGLRRQQRILERSRRMLEKIESGDPIWYAMEVGRANDICDSLHTLGEEITYWEEAKATAESEIEESAETKKYGTIEEQARADYYANQI